MNNNCQTAIQDRYAEDLQHCYGCGSLNAEGLQLKSYARNGQVVAEFIPANKYLGVPGFAYGGLIASLIDCHAMAAAAAGFQDPATGEVPRTVTAGLEVRYLKPTPLDGRAFDLVATMAESSERKAVVEVTLAVDGQVTASGRVVAVRLPDSMSG